MFWRSVALSTAVTTGVATVLAGGGAVVSQAATPTRAAAPGSPGHHATWTEADKTGFGTARTRGSNVWFTLQRRPDERGLLPRPLHAERPQPRARGHRRRSFTDRESDRHATPDHPPRRAEPPLPQVEHRHVGGRYRIAETFVTDPRRDALVVRVRLVSLDGGRYQLYALYDPALANGGMDDSGRRRRHALVASDARQHRRRALVARPRLGADQRPAARPATDGWTDLGRPAARPPLRPGRAGQRRADRPVTGVTGRPATSARLTLGSAQHARGAAYGRTTRARARFGEHRGRVRPRLAPLRPLARAGAGQRGRRAPQYLASALVLAAAEDKLHPGAFVASPSAPWVWGDEIKDLSSPSGAYHLVWSRDAYQFGTALWAMGDKAAARRIVRLALHGAAEARRLVPAELRRRPAPRSGASSSSTRSRCRSCWPTWSAATARATYARVKKAADFLAGFATTADRARAPYSPQERWENQSGYSPNSIAAQIAGLVCAADMARRNGDTALREDVAHAWPTAWQAQVKAWTVTTNGPLSRSPYFLRLTKDGKPNAGTTYAIGDGGPRPSTSAGWSTRASSTWCATASCAPRRPRRRSTLPVVDEQLRVRHAQRAVLAPLQLRRVRRDALRRGVDDHRPGRAHHPRPGLAAAHRRAR